QLFWLENLGRSGEQRWTVVVVSDLGAYCDGDSAQPDPVVINTRSCVLYQRIEQEQSIKWVDFPLYYHNTRQTTLVAHRLYHILGKDDIVPALAGGSKKAIYAALFGNLGIAIAKLIAAIFTGSTAMWAETFHSFSDTFNQILLLVGIKTSTKAATERHPFGYGKEQFF